MSDASAKFRTALAELDSCLSMIPDQAIRSLAEIIANVGRVCLYGCGREGLMMRALCMRLHHLGLDVAMVGDMTTPPVGPGDLLLVSCGPGRLASVDALMGEARKAGAMTACFTAEPEGETAAGADIIFLIPAQTMARDREAPSSILPMGSLFEGAQFLLFELLVMELQDLLGETPESMRSRHTNLE